MSRENGEHCTTCGRPNRPINSHLVSMPRRCEICSQIDGLVQGEALKRIEAGEIRFSEDLREGIYLATLKDAGEWTVATNVPHFALLHSADGYSWGYRGSGPADLALNIVEWFVRHHEHYGERLQAMAGHPERGSYHRAAGDAYQWFKDRVIAQLEPDGRRIPYAELVEILQDFERDTNRQLYVVWPDTDVGELVA